MTICPSLPTSFPLWYFSTFKLVYQNIQALSSFRDRRHHHFCDYSTFELVYRNIQALRHSRDRRHHQFCDFSTLTNFEATRGYRYWSTLLSRPPPQPISRLLEATDNSDTGYFWDSTTLLPLPEPILRLLEATDTGLRCFRDRHHNQF
jgi:hypothetical protein